MVVVHATGVRVPPWPLFRQAWHQVDMSLNAGNICFTASVARVACLCSCRPAGQVLDIQLIVFMLSCKPDSHHFLSSLPDYSPE